MSEITGKFKFEIGDMVVLATDLAAAQTATVMGETAIAVFPRQISERRLQECHGGVSQGHYMVVENDRLVPELGLVAYDEYTAELDKARCLRVDRSRVVDMDLKDLRRMILDLQKKVGEVTGSEEEAG